MESEIPPKRKKQKLIGKINSLKYFKFDKTPNRAI